MAHANEDLVRQAYKAFAEGDMDTLRSLIAPDGVHVATGNNPLSGEHQGVDNMLGYYGKLFELSDGTFRADLQSVSVEGDDTVVTTHHDSGQRNGKTLDQDENLTFTISDGKISELSEQPDDQAAMDDFWA